MFCHLSDKKPTKEQNNIPLNKYLLNHLFFFFSVQTSKLKPFNEFYIDKTPRALELFSMIFLIQLIWSIALIKIVCLSFALKMTERKAEKCGKALEALSVTLETLSSQEVSSILIVKSFDSETEVNQILSALKFTTVQIINSGRRQRKSSKHSLTLFWFQNEIQLWETVKKKNFTNATDSRLFLVFVEDKAENLILTELFESFSALAIFDVNVLLFNGVNVVMTSFVPFQDNKCRNASPVIINVFNEASREWSGEIFPNKLKNFHRCPLSFSTLEYPPAVMRKTLDNGSLHYYGSDIEVVLGLSSAMNFTVNLTFVAEPYNFGEITENGSTGAVSHVVNGEADMLMGFYFLSYERLKYLSHSHP